MNLATFTERVLRRPLWPHQAEAAKSDRFIVSGRRQAVGQDARRPSEGTPCRLHPPQRAHPRDQPSDREQPKLDRRAQRGHSRLAKPWAEMIAGKRRRVMQLRAERDRFVVEHLGELAASREHDAHAARDAVVEALEAIDVTERAYAEIERFYTELLRPVLGVMAAMYRA